MCGLVVIVERRGQIDSDRLASGLARLDHRGPDAKQAVVTTVTGNDGGELAQIGFGHTRLAILDLDERSNQPFRRDGHVLVYNGELYNFKALSAGMELSTSGDTEVLLSLLMSEGTDALTRANGMWALCWLHPERRVLTAARDRYGKKPLFYTATSDRICFASEPAALLALSGQTAKAATGALDSFLAEGWLFPRADGQTFLQDVREVRPGHALELDLASWRLTERLVTPLETDAGGPPGWDRPEELGELLADAVGARLISDRKVALLLSGGVDSTLILSILAARGWLDAVVCITGNAGKSEDAAYAQRCLDQVGVEGLSLDLDYGEASFAQFLDVCAIQAKPFPLIGNVLGMAALYTAASGEGVRVAIDGTGADEIFGGYWYRQAGFAMRDAARTGDHTWLERVMAAGMLPAELSRIDPQSLLHGRLPTPARDLLTAADLAGLHHHRRHEIANAPSSDPLVGFAGTLEEALWRDGRAGRMQEWLWQNDRNAMAASIENRSPFLDARLAKFMSSRRPGFDGAFNKVALRNQFARFTPMPTATRVDKQGFRWVYGRFLRNNIDAIRSLLAGSEIVASYVPDGTIDALFSDERNLAASKLVQRLIVLAGLEARGCLTA